MIGSFTKIIHLDRGADEASKNKNVEEIVKF